MQCVRDVTQLTKRRDENKLIKGGKTDAFQEWAVIVMRLQQDQLTWFLESSGDSYVQDQDRNRTKDETEAT